MPVFRRDFSTNFATWPVKGYVGGQTGRLVAGEAILLAIVPLFVIVDPFASVGLYLGLSAGDSMAARQRIAVKACLFAAAVLLVFTLGGKELLGFMGIELYSLQVAGGILLTLIGLRMLREGEEIPRDQIPLPTGGTHSSAPARHDPSFVPLGLPMLAGPGAISLVIVQTTSFRLSVIAIAIGAVMAASLLILLVAARLQTFIGANGTRIITRIMGLLTVAFAVQYVLDGVDGWLAA